MYEMIDLKLGLFWVESWLADLQSSFPAYIFSTILWKVQKCLSALVLGQKLCRGETLILKKNKVSDNDVQVSIFCKGPDLK